MAGQAETGAERTFDRAESASERGMAQKPSPNSGDGAVSNLRGEPSPIQRATRLQPAGEKPVKNQEITSAREATAPICRSEAETSDDRSAPSTDQADSPTDALGTERSNRDRIRDLLFDRLGFRFARGTDAEKGKAMLNRIADDLAYLSDESLAALLAMLRTKGEGTARCFWPPRATFLAIAEYIQPRPVEDIPALCSWFGSVEGPKAAANGILVETFLFIEARKLPPVADGAMRQITAQARENARRLLIVDERTAAGLSVAPDELAFARWYREKLAFCQNLMEAERRKRGHGVTADSRDGARP